MKEKDENLCAEGPLEGFRFYESLEVARKDIEILFQPAEVKVYRTFISNPPCERDFASKFERNVEDNAAANKEITQEEYDAFSAKDKRLFIAERGLSVNATAEQAIDAARTSFKNVAKTRDLEGAEAYMEDDRGRYIGEIQWKADQAIITKFDKKGHATVLLNKNIDWKEIEVKDIKEYKYKDNDQDE